MKIVNGLMVIFLSMQYSFGAVVRYELTKWENLRTANPDNEVLEAVAPLPPGTIIEVDTEIAAEISGVKYKRQSDGDIRNAAGSYIKGVKIVSLPKKYKKLSSKIDKLSESKDFFFYKKSLESKTKKLSDGQLELTQSTQVFVDLNQDKTSAPEEIAEEEKEDSTSTSVQDIEDKPQEENKPVSDLVEALGTDVIEVTEGDFVDDCSTCGPTPAMVNIFADHVPSFNYDESDVPSFIKADESITTEGYLNLVRQLVEQNVPKEALDMALFELYNNSGFLADVIDMSANALGNRWTDRERSYVTQGIDPDKMGRIVINDFSKPTKVKTESGEKVVKRAFLIDLKNMKIQASGYVSNGSGSQAHPNVSDAAFEAPSVFSDRSGQSTTLLGAMKLAMNSESNNRFRTMLYGLQTFNSGQYSDGKRAISEDYAQSGEFSRGSVAYDPEFAKLIFDNNSEFSMHGHMIFNYHPTLINNIPEFASVTGN